MTTLTISTQRSSTKIGMKKTPKRSAIPAGTLSHATQIGTKRDLYAISATDRSRSDASMRGATKARSPA